MHSWISRRSTGTDLLILAAPARSVRTCAALGGLSQDPGPIDRPQTREPGSTTSSVGLQSMLSPAGEDPQGLSLPPLPGEESKERSDGRGLHNHSTLWRGQSPYLTPRLSCVITCSFQVKKCQITTNICIRKNLKSTQTPNNRK